MKFDDAKQEFVLLIRDEVRNLTHPEIVAALVQKADDFGQKPMDLNWAGTPNVYLRGRYSGTEPDVEWLGDLFIMFVEAK